MDINWGEEKEKEERRECGGMNVVYSYHGKRIIIEVQW